MEGRPTSPSTGPGAGLDADRMPAHWLLARMGKRVLRPGGRALTRELLALLAVTSDDDVVELAPGLGETTRELLARAPRSYVGVERDERAATQVEALLHAGSQRCVVGTAEQTGLDDASASVVFGEAFLTMQPEPGKRQMVREAFRVLQPGGRYGLHELALTPDALADDEQQRVRDDLAGTLRVGARPLTVADWHAVVADAGFEVRAQRTAPMALLRARRVLDDEDVAGAARIVSNVARDPAARRRVRAIRAAFRRHADSLVAVPLVAVKPSADALSGS